MTAARSTTRHIYGVTLFHQRGTRDVHGVKLPLCARGFCREGECARQDWLIKLGQTKQDQGAEWLALINIKFIKFSQLPRYTLSSADCCIGENTRKSCFQKDFCAAMLFLKSSNLH